MSRERLFIQIAAGLDRAYAKHGELPWDRHEFYAILLEEVDELWEAIKKDAPIQHVLDEVNDVLTVCARYFETGDRHKGAYPKEKRIEKRVELFTKVNDALEAAYAKHGDTLWGRHGFYGILKEEIDEIWDAVRHDEPLPKLLDELVQVIVAAVHYIETGDRYNGAHPHATTS